MRVADQLRQQGVEKFRHCYLRYEALLAQLRAEAGAGGGVAAGGPVPGALLHRLLAAFGADGDDEGGGGWQRAAAAAAVAALPGPTAFERAFLQEVQRLRLFVKSSLEQLWLALLDATAQLRGLGEELLQAGAASAGQSQALGARLAALRGAYDATAQELVLLERFLRQNVAAAAQLAQMHDQQWQAAQQACSSAQGGPQEGGSSSELPLESVEGAYLAALHSSLLGELRLEPLVVGLSDGYELCRLIESDAAALAGQPAKWVPPDKFQRVTRKFWLHPADVMRFKAEVMRHLPILIYGDRTKLTESSPWEVQFLRDQRGVSDSAEVSSVYYDNPASLPSYHARLRKDDMASVVRLRWYGERSPGGDQPIFVERKVHRDRYTGEFSYKERAPMAQRHVEAYTGGALVPEMVEQRHSEFLADAQQFLLHNGQAPLVRTVYRRTAFQESSNNQVRISLDSQLHMVRETGAPRAPGDWCRDMGAPLLESDTVYFPYAVVEIKLQSAPPAWVQGLLQTGMLLPVPKFSKFLHGTALLFQPRCANVPYWFLPDESDPCLMTPATWEEMADPADEYLQKGASWLFPKTRGFDEGGFAAGPDEQEPAATPAPDPEAVPYRPAPLRFLRRNKTAPVPGAGSLSPSSSTEDGSSGGAAGIGVPAASGWGHLTVAGGVGGAAAFAARQPQQAYQQQAQQQPPQPLACFTVAASAAPAVPAAAAAAAAGQQQQVHRNITWPVYNNPLAALPPSEPSCGSLAMRPPQPAAVALELPGGAAAAAAATVAAAAQQEARPPSPPHSHTSTPQDSAQDLEAGGVGSPDKSSGSLPSAGKPAGGSSKASGNSAAAAAATLPPGPAFGVLQYRLPGAPPTSPGSGDTTPEPRGRAKALVRTRVEPKTFFANERTFLQWLQISVLILMTATSMLSGTGLLSGLSSKGSAAASCDSTNKACFASKLSGAIIAPVGLLFMAYALFQYRLRTYQILRRETARYDDQRGTTVLTVILASVFILAYVLSMIFMF